jgi:hypothetical protein
MMAVVWVYQHHLRIVCISMCCIPGLESQEAHTLQRLMVLLSVQGQMHVEHRRTLPPMELRREHWREVDAHHQIGMLS